MSYPIDDTSDLPLGPSGYRRLYDPVTKRRIFLLHYTALGPEAAERVRAKAVKYDGGIDGALWRADQELDLEAQPGKRVFTHWDRDRNVRSVCPNVAIRPHLMGFDFGHDNATAILLAQVTPKQIQVYFEHYLSGQVEAVHKGRMLLTLREWAWFQELEKGLGERVFSFWKAVGDPSGLNYKANYAVKPFPIAIDNPSHDPNYRDVDGGESLLNGYLAVGKRCCWRRWPDPQEKCGVCDKALEFDTGLVVDPSCLQTRRQIPAQATLENGRRAKVADHTVDALRYLVLRAKTVRKTPRKAKEPDPWWLQKPKPSSSREHERSYGSNQHIANFMR
jgi:hypothetical protein